MKSVLRRSISVLSIVSAFSFLVVAPPAYALECGDGQIVNGGFEAPVLGTLVSADIIYIESWGGPPHRVWDSYHTPPRWAMVEALPSVDTTVSQALAWSATEGAVELQQNFAGGAGPANSGNQWAEITGLDVSNTLFQVVETVPGTVMTWTLAHRGLSGTDVMQVEIGADVDALEPQDATPETGSGGGNSMEITDGTSWRTWTGTYTVPNGQTSTVFGFHGISSSTGDPTTGNLIDDIGFACDVALTNEANDGSGGNPPDNNSSHNGQKLAFTGIETNEWASLLATGLLLSAAASVMFFLRHRVRRSRANH